MAVNYMRIVVSRSASVIRRDIASSAARFGAAATVEVPARDRIHPRIGNRDIVGYGKNGSASFIETVVDPYPAIRFSSNTAESDALMQKATGDWKLLSLAEKKALYRHSFCQTFAEMDAPSSEWKSITTGVLILFGISCWVYMLMRNTMYKDMQPHTMSPEWQKAQRERMIDQGQGRVEGLSSHWDYENKKWKK